MRIAVILPSLAQRGPILVARDIVSSLLERRLIDGACVFFFDDIVEVEFPCEVRRVKWTDRVDFSTFDVVHSHMFRPDVYVFFNRLLKRIERGKSITTLHQYDYENLKVDLGSRTLAFAISVIWRLGLSFHETVVCLSDDMLRFYKYRLINRNVYRIYNGRDIDCSELSGSMKLCSVVSYDESSRITIGTWCLLNKRKGIEQVIKTLPLLPNVKYVVIGEGSEREGLMHLATELGVDERCEFRGFIRNPLSIAKEIDVFVFPSRSEGFGLALIEAAACGLPIACSRIPIFSELFTEEEVCFFELDNTESLVLAVNRAISSRGWLSKRAHERYLLNYTSGKMADGYLEIYRKLSS